MACHSGCRLGVAKGRKVGGHGALSAKAQTAQAHVHAAQAANALAQQAAEAQMRSLPGASGRGKVCCLKPWPRSIGHGGAMARAGSNLKDLVRSAVFLARAAPGPCGSRSARGA